MIRNIFVILCAAGMLASCSTDGNKGVRRIALQSDSLMMVADSMPFYLGKNLYLVIMEYQSPKPAFLLDQEIGYTETRLLPGYIHIDSLRRTGIPIFGGVMALKSGCAFIIQADDNLELQKLIKENPLTEASHVTVTPLVSFGESLFRQKEKLAQLKERQAKSK